MMGKNVIGFHYTVSDSKKNVIDSSDGGDPLLFLEGTGSIIPGLEKELVALAVGDKKEVTVKAQEAYGEVVPDMIVTVKRTQFPEGAELSIGDQFQINEEPNAPIFRIVKIEEEDVTIDGNHPLAGEDLCFNIEITEKREATASEIEHGHAHEAGGHNH